VETERARYEANVEIIRRHDEIRHGRGGKRREVGMDDWSWEHPRPWIALVRRCRSVGDGTARALRRRTPESQRVDGARRPAISARAGARR
jgi:hypothetical protein